MNTGKELKLDRSEDVLFTTTKQKNHASYSNEGIEKRMAMGGIPPSGCSDRNGCGIGVSVDKKDIH